MVQQWCNNECYNFDLHFFFLKSFLDAFKFIYTLKIIKLMNV